jgi:hypothetical protein
VFKEIDEIGFLLAAKPKSEPLVVEVDDLPQRCRRTVVEIGSACCQPSKNRTLEPADILALAGDHRPPRIGDFVDFILERIAIGDVGALQREHRQPGDIQRGRLFVAGIGYANVERSLD